MIYIEYRFDNPAHSDFDTESDYELLLQAYRAGEDVRILSSTSPIFYRIRLGIVSGEIDCNDVIFTFGDHTIKVNRFGAISDWPEGFCDLEISLSEKILATAMKKKKKENAMDKYDQNRLEDYKKIYEPIDAALQTRTYAFDPGVDLFDQKNPNNSVHLPFWFAARLAQYIQEMEELRNGDT